MLSELFEQDEAQSKAIIVIERVKAIFFLMFYTPFLKRFH